MGCGPGPVIEKISLEDYQIRVTNSVMTKTGLEYEFVANHTIPDNIEIEFGPDDQIIIDNEDLVVVLEGKLDISEDTDTINRITINNGIFNMEDCSEINFGDIVSGRGINIQNTGFSTFNMDGGVIKINNVREINSFGIYTQLGVFNHNKGNIEIDSVSAEARGIYATGGGTININGNLIKIDEVTGESRGISQEVGGSINHDGANISIGEISNSFGINVQAGNFTSTSGNIKIESVLNEGRGININPGSFNLSGGNITIESIIGGLTSNGIYIRGDGSEFNLNNGVIRFETIDNAIGFHVTDKSILNNNDDMIFENTINNGICIQLIQRSTFNQDGGNIDFQNINSVSWGIRSLNLENIININSGIINFILLQLFSFGFQLDNQTILNHNGGDIIYNTLASSSTAIFIKDSIFTKVAGPTINITGLLDVSTFGIQASNSSQITNLGPFGSINMTNSGTPYTPALLEPLVAPWNGAGSLRGYYLP